MTQWLIDPAHSEVKFKVKHLVISTVTGQFRKISGSVISEKSDFSDAQVSFAADVDSISTNNDQRDGHLKSPDFFDAASYPSLTFTSTSITQVADHEFAMRGTMMIRGVAKEVNLSVIYNGTVKGFEGDVAAFEITGKLNRQDFGLRWNALTESGGVVVGDEVKLEIAVELKKVEVAEPEMA